MEKSAETKEQVVILRTFWKDQEYYIGTVVTLDTKENDNEWASATVGNSVVIISRYAPATELNKALF